MKKYFFLLFAATLAVHAGMCQPIPIASIEDSVLGWVKVYRHKGAKTGMTVGDKVYSVNQLSICDTFLNWMQASYVPKGGLGDIYKLVTGKIGLYNQNDAALPQSYGAYSKTYYELKYSGGKRVPLSDGHERWSIMANATVGIPADAVCTPTQYYFTLPSFKEQGFGDELPNLYGLATHPNTRKYFTYFKRNSKIGNEKTVVLYPEGKFPFVRITKGEYLQVVEGAVKRLYDSEKKSIYDKAMGKQRDIDYFMKYLNENHEKRVAKLQASKEKYKNRLQEVAEIYSDQPSLLLENYEDVFEGTGNSGVSLPVYKIDPAIAEACKKDKPQWITITWHGDVTSPVGKHQHESIINNFNFEYVYNFFFYPDKVKGQAYKPLHSPYANETAVVTAASEASKRNTADKNIYFFDDFSTTGIGKKPNGWKTFLSAQGTTGTVAIRDGLNGNWVELKGHHIVNSLKGTTPQNFTLTYDVVATQNFTWGAKGLTMQLSKEKSPGNVESFLLLRLRPGFDGRDGEATVETQFPQGYTTGTKWYKAIGFSNNKKNNLVSVTIKKTGELLQVFIDNSKIAEYEKAMPAGQTFNVMSFNCSNNSAETDKYYVSNIRISKD